MLIKNPSLIKCTLPAVRAFDRYESMPDIARIFDGLGTFPENLIEFAGRVCYKSTDAMGNAPDFIAARIREGHTDILEHGWLSMEVSVPDAYTVTELYRDCRYLVVDPIPGTEDTFRISGSFRGWLEYFGDNPEIMTEASIVAPVIFGRKAPITITSGTSYNIQPRQIGRAKVALLALHVPNVADLPADRHDLHRSATFLIEGISRTCSHQFVRHRLGSFSQESQRYVDLEKGGWSAVIPPAIAANPAALEIMNEFWQIAEEKYEQLRELGIRKEDARFLLPNAAETRFVVTLSLAGWKHFLALREPKAAQWEIRNVAKMVRGLLTEVGLL